MHSEQSILANNLIGTVLPKSTFYASVPFFQFGLFYIYWDGAYYIGGYKDGWHHGYGEYYYSNGDVYKGNWVSSNKEGQGTMTYNDGTVKSGLWKDGKFQE